MDYKVVGGCIELIHCIEMVCCIELVHCNEVHCIAVHCIELHCIGLDCMAFDNLMVVVVVERSNLVEYGKSLVHYWHY
jgi:hypothetical protein